MTRTRSLEDVIAFFRRSEQREGEQYSG